MNQTQNPKNQTGIETQPQKWVFTCSALTCFLIWLAFPPIGVWQVGWIALAPLAILVSAKKLEGRLPYLKIWFAGLFFWLGTFYFIPIPHPALWAGWAAISIYLACYLPLAVGISRTMHHVTRLPVFICIPIVWTGLELVRCYLFTGMGLVCLSHTQYLHPEIIQIADLSGAYGLTFVLAMVAACVGMLLSKSKSRPMLGLAHLLPAAALVAGVWWYGQLKLNESISEDKSKSVTIAIIQGSVDATLPKTEEQVAAFRETLVSEYAQLTQRALYEWTNVDLVLWPEGTWPQPDLLPDTDFSRMLEEDKETVRRNQDYYWTQALGQTTAVFPEFLTGGVSADPIDFRQYGAALRIDSAGLVTERYFKNHLVMFGEYVPLAEYIRPLQDIPAIGRGLNFGTESITMDFKGVKLAPNICFETTVPHFMRRQVNDLEAGGDEPDVIVNLTNDGWFYGTTCLDFHLACNVFRAVELRKTNIVCANTGFSAEISDRGEIIQRGPRRKTGTLLAKVSPRETDSLYREIGDIAPISMAGVSGLFLLIGFALRTRSWISTSASNKKRGA